MTEPTSTPLQDLEERIKSVEEEFASAIKMEQEEEVRRQAEFQARQAELYQGLTERLDSVRRDVIDSTLSAEPEPVTCPPATAFDGTMNLAEYEKFAQHPYFMYPGKRGTVYVVVPKFFPSFQVVWLLDEIDNVWNRYEVNQYAVLFGSVPEQIREHLNMH